MHDAGFPLVTIEQVGDVDAAATSITYKLTQKRFRSVGSADASSYLWQIPMVVQAEGVEAPVKFTMSEAEQTVTVPVKNASKAQMITSLLCVKMVPNILI